MKIALLPGDGIGPEVIAQARRLLDACRLPGLTIFEGDVGGIAYRRHGTPLPEETLVMVRACDAVLFGAVGDPQKDMLPREQRPEQAILGLRRALGLFANLRPASAFPGLAHLSPLKADIAGDIDCLIVRELTGDVYFGEKGVDRHSDGTSTGWDRMSYSTPEVERIARMAFTAAGARRQRVTSVDKANVLHTSGVWRDTVTMVAKDYPDIALEHMYVDNAAMQMVRAPQAFDVVLTGNLFGDILSDQASACVGSIGLMPSASLGERKTRYGTFGLYEPIHGSAPDIAGTGRANPIAAILSLAMLLRHSLGREEDAARVERAVAQTLADNVLGHDLAGTATTSAIGDAVLARL